jgi:hypothetical protein
LRNVLLDLQRGEAGGVCQNLDLRIRDIWNGIYRQILRSSHTGSTEQENDENDEGAVIYAKIYETFHGVRREAVSG